MAYGLKWGDRMDISLEQARQLDEQDDLARFRDEFVFDDSDLIYMDGNSLGRLPCRTQDRLAMAVQDEWGHRLIRAWNEGWFEASERIGGKIASLVGADGGEVILADSTSVNLFKLALAGVLAKPERSAILTDDLNFPSDLYILQGVAQATGRRLVTIPSQDGIRVPPEGIRDALDERAALLALSHTAFKSAFTHDMARVTELAHDAGALVLWDMSHSVGAVAIDLGGAGADLGVGCTYKYLNGGPGSPAFMYVRSDLQAGLANPITGWFSQRAQFDMELRYQPAGGMRRFLSGTPPVLSLLAIETGVDLLIEAGMDRVREKVIALSEFMIALWEAELEPLGFRLNSPRAAAERGGHVSFGHDHALAIDLALINEMDVLPDFRQPDNIRLGLSPLYTGFVDVYQAVQRLHDVVKEGRYQKYIGQRPEVT